MADFLIEFLGEILSAVIDFAADRVISLLSKKHK